MGSTEFRGSSVQEIPTESCCHWEVWCHKGEAFSSNSYFFNYSDKKKCSLFLKYQRLLLMLEDKLLLSRLFLVVSPRLLSLYTYDLTCSMVPLRPSFVSLLLLSRPLLSLIMISRLLVLMITKVTILEVNDRQANM